MSVLERENLHHGWRRPGSRLFLVHRVHNAKNGAQQALWLCDCSKYVIHKINLVFRGKVKSCGCLRDDTAKENLEKARAHLKLVS